MRTLYFLLFFSALISCHSCIKAPNYPDEPVITFLNLSKNLLKQGSFQNDSLWVNISFTDGDGNLGDLDSFNVFLIDNRDGFISNKYTIPVIPEDASGNGIAGEISLLLFSTCCYYPDGFPPCEPNPNYPVDTVSYNLYIKDRSGNQSNTVTTDNITLLCQ